MQSKKDESKGAQLSVEDAAKFIAASFTREYRIKCLAFWRELWGDEYADAVKARVEQIFRKRKGDKNGKN